MGIDISIQNGNFFKLTKVGVSVTTKTCKCGNRDLPAKYCSKCGEEVKTTIVTELSDKFNYVDVLNLGLDSYIVLERAHEVGIYLSIKGNYESIKMRDFVEIDSKLLPTTDKYEKLRDQLNELGTDVEFKEFKGVLLNVY